MRQVPAAVTTRLDGATFAVSENGSTNGHPAVTALPSHSELVDSYRRLADVFHHVLSEQSLDTLLDRIADTLADLIPYDTLSIFQADEAQTVLTPVLARDRWADEIMRNKIKFGAGLAGWAAQHREPVLTNHAHLDKRMMVVPGTPPDEKEALITVPLIARGTVKGVLSIYRLGEDARFDEEEFELAKRFGDAAALAIDNAQTRARLELQAQTDSLTGLYNHRYFHESLRAELTRSSRSQGGSVALLMLDIDDFKKVNDVYGHGVGDQVLRELAEQLKKAVRGSDVVCRLGGEEFGVVMGSCGTRDALGLATRLTQGLAETEFGPAGKITISIGVAEGPKHASNPRELIVCAEAAMMTAKARGKDKIVLFDESTDERPDSPSAITRDVRSISHLKMLQSLAGKLNRLTDLREIGMTISDELRALIDYHNCRVTIIEGDEIVPIAFRGVLSSLPGEDAHLPRSKVGEGITGRAVETRKSLLVGNALDCEFAVTIPGTEPIEESLLAVPLCYGARVVGVIVISKLGTDQFDEDDVRLLEVLGGHAAVALENARLFESQRREAEHLKELLEFSRELASAEGLPEVLRRVVELTATILGTPTTSVWLQDSDGKLAPAALWGYGNGRRERLVGVGLDPADIGELADRTEPFLLEHDVVAAIEGASEVELGAKYAVAPVKLDGDRLCCIVATIRGDRTDEFDDAKMSLLAGLAHQAKLAITNAGSFENLEATFVSTVEALANALEANDEYTSSHTRWITDMALQVGSELGLEGKDLKRLELGALFHDIGKIGIPASILLKPGPLTDEERAIMQQHPELGEKILAPIKRLAEVRSIVRSCHEHFDGSGYPDRRSGDEIPVEARIVLVCDAFHAMTTDRPYRKRLPVEEAIRRLREASGTQFDPAVVGAFMKVHGEPLQLADARLAS